MAMNLFYKNIQPHEEDFYEITKHILLLGDGSRVRLPTILLENSKFLLSMLEEEEEEDDVQIIPLQNIIKTKHMFCFLIRALIEIVNNEIMRINETRHFTIPLHYSGKKIYEMRAITVDGMILYNIASMLSVECIEIIIEKSFIYYGMKHRNNNNSSLTTTTTTTTSNSSETTKVVNAGVLGLVGMNYSTTKKRLFDEITQGGGGEEDETKKKQKILNFILLN